VVGVLNGYFNPNLCADNVAWAPGIPTGTAKVWSSKIAAAFGNLRSHNLAGGVVVPVR
jgi:hypothetical protein